MDKIDEDISRVKCIADLTARLQSVVWADQWCDEKQILGGTPGDSPSDAQKTCQLYCQVIKTKAGSIPNRESC